MDQCKEYIKNWKLGHYGEQSSISKGLDTDIKKDLFINLVVELLEKSNPWKSYLSIMAAGASAFYRNPSYAYFYNNPNIKKAFLKKLLKSNVPRVSEIEAELFDIFAANIEYNMEIHNNFIQALKKSLSKTSTYNELYNEYLTYYLRLYLNTLKLSEKDLKMFKFLIIDKIDKWGQPDELEKKAFFDTVQTFGVETHNVKQIEEESSKSSFIFFKKQETTKKIQKSEIPYEEIIIALRSSN